MRGGELLYGLRGQAYIYVCADWEGQRSHIGSVVGRLVGAVSIVSRYAGLLVWRYAGADTFCGIDSATLLEVTVLLWCVVIVWRVMPIWMALLRWKDVCVTGKREVGEAKRIYAVD